MKTISDWLSDFDGHDILGAHDIAVNFEEETTSTTENYFVL